ncbi:hypothetical protein TELCIR_12991 [Teladorsagia circumcincta]|uniref:Uncharacterized protein n=1 Tax=Teladorsagia circumcincta TaxID=45464 RepID=A0A2G9U578_TELCI|nr:hypothetical protein TELCIR_12991 [Teladorsagia circumcincta]
MGANSKTGSVTERTSTMTPRADRTDQVGDIVKIPPPDDEQQSDKSEKTTPWRSVYIAALCSFVQALQFGLFFSSLWPYLKRLDPTVSESFFGYVVAIYSLGSCLASPAFGYWSNRIKQVTQYYYEHTLPRHRYQQIVRDLSDVLLPGLLPDLSSDQGTMQGVFQMSGSIARMTEPILLNVVYAKWGPRGVWLVEIAQLMVTLVLWIIFLKRLVPLEKRFQTKKEIEEKKVDAVA